MTSILSSDAALLESCATAASVAGKTAASTEVELAACDCCGLKEECTAKYVDTVRETFHGRWICGLCAEAVKDEAYRSNRVIGTEEALNLHMNFCKNFRSSDPTKRVIATMRQLLRRCLDVPRAVSSAPSSPNAKGRSTRLERSGSCLPSVGQ